MDESKQRIGDPERERARATLERQATEGRLTMDELSDRLEQVYAAATVADLERSLQDLPPLPSTDEVLESIGKLGALYHRGALRKSEFAARKAELLGGLGSTDRDDVDAALDRLTQLYHSGFLDRREFSYAKAQLLPHV